MEPEPEPEPSTPPLWPSDGDVAALVLRRRATRLSGDFAASDTIRSGLAALGVFLLDTAVDEEAARVVETRHAAAAQGISWVRAKAAGQPSGSCKFWRHKSRSYCGEPVQGIGSSPAEIWASLQHLQTGDSTSPADGNTRTVSAAEAEWLDLSRLHYCPSCTARQQLARRCPCPFDPRHSILLTKLSGHVTTHAIPATTGFSLSLTYLHVCFFS